MNRSNLWALVLASSLGLVVALGGCGKVSSEPSLGGETHWLRNCVDGAACGAGLECLCGVCTTACTDDASCDRVGAGASCSPASVSSHASSCDLQAPNLVCLPVAGELASDSDTPFGWLQTCGVLGHPGCGAGLECFCGVCTMACSDDASCSAWEGDGFCAERATSRHRSLCDSSAPERVCLSATYEASTSFSIVEGNRYDERGCFQDSRFAGTTIGACEPGEVFGRNPNDGRCWRFPNGCVPMPFMSLSPAVRSQEACSSVTDLCPDSLPPP